MINIGNNIAVDEPLALSNAFDLLALPGEIRQYIYRHYLGSWDAVIEYERKSTCFKIKGQPQYQLLFTNRNISRECRCYIQQAYSGRLILRDAKVRRERGFGFVSSIDIVESLCPKWMLEKTSVLCIEQGSTGMLMGLPWHQFKSLEEVQLEGHSLPVAYYYPCALSAQAKTSREEHVFEGRYDTWCVNGYNSWSQVPKPVSEEQVRVVTIRRGIVKGSTLMIKVQHKSDRAEVLERYINSILEPNIVPNKAHIVEH